MSAFFRHKHQVGPFHQSDMADNNLEGTVKKLWVEDSWSQLTDQGLEHGSTLGFLGLAVPAKKFFWLSIIMGAVFLLLLSRSFYLQIWRGNFYLARAEANRLHSKMIAAERGIFYDAKMRPLVTNVPTFSLELLPGELPKDPIQEAAIIEEISKIAAVSSAEIKNTLIDFKSFNYRAVTIKDNLDYESAVRLLTQSAELPGLSIETKTKRQYLSSEGLSSLAHLLGYLGKVSKADLDKNYLPTDYLGKSGLEKSYEEILRGWYGKQEIEVDSMGREKGIVSQEPPLPGQSLILALDLDLQRTIEESLTRQLRSGGKKRAAAIALNPQTGAILALVNLPAYDNNLFSQGLNRADYKKLIEDESRPLFSRAWSGEYPAGSVIKPLLAAAALEEKLIDDQTTFLSTGGLRVNDWFFSDWKAGGHGLTNVVKALAESVNTFFFTIGGGYKNFSGLGVDKILSYYKKFGLTKRLGIDLPNEAAGFLPSPDWKQKAKNERWYIGDTYNITIGQGDVLVTPLQVASYTAALANGGTLYEPHLVEALLTPEGARHKLPARALAKELVSRETLAIVNRGLGTAITQGSARDLASLPVTVAGKTGTAQWSSLKSPHAWFTGFAPATNPRLVLTILIEEGGEGSYAAVPVAKEVLTWWAKR